jgi:outer membrane receptor protein involved in Fe transport
VTLNFGGRFDAYDGYRRESQFSPRINAVWTPWSGGTFHLGYARYFSPAPFELVGGRTVALFEGTTGASEVTQDTAPYAERQDYYDAGFVQKVAQVPGLSLSIDGYVRRSKNLLDEGQFGAPIILTPFNYRRGKISGLELSANYAHGPWTAYANFAYARAMGKDIVSSQFNFSPEELDYIANHYIFLDHDQTQTVSAGVSYRFHDGIMDGTRVSGALLYGSGLRTDGAVPNGGVLPSYAQVNASISREFDLPGVKGMEVRLDAINLFDSVYLIRDGAGVGVGAPQYGPRRGLFVGVSKKF